MSNIEMSGEYNESCEMTWAFAEKKRKEKSRVQKIFV